MEGWKAFFFIDWFAGLMSPQQLRLYVGASWVLSAGWLLYGLAKGSIG
jgi:hypothetical protein